MVKFRNEIQHLRGISIVAVLCFHLAPNTFKNGFLGVDVFFVISGFLITEQLLGLESSSLRKYLATFYFRRLKRIVPSAIWVLILTLIASNFLLGTVTLLQNLESAKWANLFGANWYFAKENLDYFAVGNLDLLQHYWSLAIEEQFYLFWPLLIFFNRRRVFLPLLVVITSLSLFCTSAFPLNFYGTWMRIWELAFGALLAIAPIRNTKRLGLWMPWLILTLLLLPISVPKVFSTILIVLITSLYVSQALPTNYQGPLYVLGQLSYILYLVHYPVIRIMQELYPNQASWLRLLTILLATLFISILSHKFIENYFRNRNYRKPANLIVGALLTIGSIQIILIMIRGYYV